MDEPAEKNQTSHLGALCNENEFYPQSHQQLNHLNKLSNEVSMEGYFIESQQWHCGFKRDQKPVYAATSLLLQLESPLQHLSSESSHHHCCHPRLAWDCQFNNNSDVVRKDFSDFSTHSTSVSSFQFSTTFSISPRDAFKTLVAKLPSLSPSSPSSFLYKSVLLLMASSSSSVSTSSTSSSSSSSSSSISAASSSSSSSLSSPFCKSSTIQNYSKEKAKCNETQGLINIFLISAWMNTPFMFLCKVQVYQDRMDNKSGHQKKDGSSTSNDDISSLNKINNKGNKINNHNNKINDNFAKNNINKDLKSGMESEVEVNGRNVEFNESSIPNSDEDSARTNPANPKNNNDKAAKINENTIITIIKNNNNINGEKNSKAPYNHKKYAHVLSTDHTKHMDRYREHVTYTNIKKYNPFHSDHANNHSSVLTNRTVLKLSQITADPDPSNIKQTMLKGQKKLTTKRWPPKLSEQTKNKPEKNKIKIKPEKEISTKKSLLIKPLNVAREPVFPSVQLPFLTTSTSSSSTFSSSSSSFPNFISSVMSPSSSSSLPPFFYPDSKLSTSSRHSSSSPLLPSPPLPTSFTSYCPPLKSRRSMFGREKIKMAGAVLQKTQQNVPLRNF